MKKRGRGKTERKMGRDGKVRGGQVGGGKGAKRRRRVGERQMGERKCRGGEVSRLEEETGMNLCDRQKKINIAQKA